MQLNGEVVAIYTAGAGSAPMHPVADAVLEAGRGLVGDRYYRDTGTFSAKLKGKPDSEITLIEAEEIERFNAEHDASLGLGAPRRNIVTRHVRLNEFVGRRFKIGEVLLEGIRLCEPCAHLAKTVDARVVPGLAHRAGLRACVVTGGKVRPGDAIMAA